MAHTSSSNAVCRAVAVRSTAVRYYRCLPQRTTRGSNGLRTVIHTPTARLPPNADDCQANLKRLARRTAKRKPRRPICTPPASACEPDAARWTHRAGSHPGRDMCGMALRGACAPDIRRGTEFTHWRASRQRLLLKFRLKYASSTNVLCPFLKKHTVPNVLCPVFGLFCFQGVVGDGRWS